jgi:predicted nucleic acid-binding protein
VIVVDASVLATALGDDGPDGDHARARLRGERLSAPELVDLEIISVLRRQVHNGAADLRRAALALADLAALPLRRAPHRPLLARCWELRDNLTVYDASYVALAETLDVTLLTGDSRLARAPGLRCQVETFRSATLSGASAFLSCREPELSGLLQQDLSLEAVGVPEEHAQRPAEIVDRAVARPGVHQPVPDRVERFA